MNNFWIDRRVADDEEGYPASEAMFVSPRHYVEHLEADRDRLAAELSAARAALDELIATVEGECPSLLDTDRGGSMVLFNLIEKARAAPSAGAQYATGTDLRCPKCKGIGPCSECNPDPRAGLTVRAGKLGTASSKRET